MEKNGHWLLNFLMELLIINVSENINKLLQKVYYQMKKEKKLSSV